MQEELRTPESTPIIFADDTTHTIFDGDTTTVADVETLPSVTKTKIYHNDKGHVKPKSHDFNGTNDFEQSAQMHFPGFPKRHEGIIDLPWEKWIWSYEWIYF